MHIFGRMVRTLVVLGSCTAVISCYRTSALEPGGFEDITSIVLRAWEDTRAGLPPLAITRQDSVTIVMDFINTRRTNWTNADAALPGRPLFAELRRGSAVVGRFGFIEISHGAGGYFIMRDGSKDQLRPATAQELATFLAFFGIGVVIVSDP